MEPMSISRPDLDCFNIAELKKERILKTAVVYGHNSFGKSNIFKAIENMLDVIKNCTNPSYKISIDCFKLDDFSRNNPSFFELTVVLGEITYRYGFEIHRDIFLYDFHLGQDGRRADAYGFVFQGYLRRVIKIFNSCLIEGDRFSAY